MIGTLCLTLQHKPTQPSRTESYGLSLRYEQQNIPAILFGDRRR